MTPTPVRVLIADDAPEMRSLLRWAFERDADVQVVGAVAEPEALLACMDQVRPDVVVLDLQMPGMSPAELLEAVGTASPSLPIVTFSGYEPELVAPEQAARVRLHIPKTTDLAVVRQAVVDVVRRA